MTLTLQSLIEEVIPKRAIKVKARLKGVNGTLFIEAAGTDERGWTLKLVDGVVEVKRGQGDNINCAIKADTKTWNSLLCGRLSYMKALLVGKLRIKGDRLLALKITNSLLG